MMIKAESKSKINLTVAMLIFGTVGIFSKYIPLPSGVIALARSVIGLLFLVAFMLVSRKKPDFSRIKQNIVWLVSSGICLGANWILFFMACKNTSIPTATLSYYLAPAILVISSAFIFKEKLGVKEIASVAVSLLGIALASGVIGEQDTGASFIGVLYGIMAAVLYAAVVTFNKKMKDIEPIDKTMVQFLISSIALLPYVIFAESALSLTIDTGSLVGLIIIGTVHTGIAYMLYFGSATVLKSSTVALLSYIDPIISILVSVLFFGEVIGVLGIIGAIFVIGSAMVGELDIAKLVRKVLDEKTQDNTKNVNISKEYSENENR